MMSLWDIIYLIEDRFPESDWREGTFIPEIIRLYAGGQTEVINVAIGERRCDKCDFWYYKEGSGVKTTVIECRLHPSSLKKEASDWCGQFRKKIDIEL